jgi:hypothetical protein
VTPIRAGPRHPRLSLRSPTAPSSACGSPTCCPTSAAGCSRRGGLGDDQPHQEPIFVALLAAAGTLPMFLFCFLRRHPGRPLRAPLYIIVCQVWMMAVAAPRRCWPSSAARAWNLLALHLLHGPGQRHECPGLARQWCPRSSRAHSFGPRSRSTAQASTSPAPSAR